MCLLYCRDSESYPKYDTAPKYTKSVAGLSVSACSPGQYDDYYTLMAQ
jgi:hypothetical protein